MEFHTFTLPNGIRVIHKQTDSEVSHCGLVINAGSRDEHEDQEGLAHFIEHSIFKGTKKRKTFHILSRLDSVGGEINAYTTKEDTWVYASSQKKHFERSIELITDICFNSIFPEKELLKEKDVIIDEINSYQDSPSEIIFDEFDELCFDGHTLGRNILGTVESVKRFKREDIFELVNRRYRTDQMVFSSVSNHSIRDIKKLCEKYIGGFQTEPTIENRVPFSGYVPQHKEVNKDTYQIHYLLGNIAYDINHDYKTGLILLNNYLGGPAMNSRLNLMIREKHGIAYNIESNYAAYSDTGLFHIYLGTDKKFFNKSKKLVQKELKLLRDKRLGPTQLHMAKQQLIGQIALAQESGVGTMLALGKSLLAYNRVDSLQEVFAKVDAVSSSDILEIANQTLNIEDMSSLTYIN